MADVEYKISLGVDVDTSGIQEQINSNVRGKISPIKIDIDLNHTKNQINTIKSQIQSLNNVKVNLGVGSGRNGVKGSVNDVNWAYRQMLDVQKKANSLSLKINGLDTSKNVNELKELSLQFARLRSDYETLKKTFGGQLSINQLGNLQAELDETDAKLSAMDAKLADTRTNLAKKIELKLSTGDFSNQVKKVESDANKLSGTYQEIETGIANVNQALKNMQTSSAKGDIDGLIEANKNYERALKDVYNQIQINTRAEKDVAASQKLDDSRNAFMSNIDAWLTKNSAATKKFGAQMLELKAQAKSCDQVTLNHLRTEFKRLDKEAEAAGLKMQTFGDRIKAQFSRYSQYFSVASLMIYATQGLKDMFNQVVAIDSAMTELKKVTDETDASYNQFLNSAASKAKELGTTIDGLVGSTADFARLGYGFKESQGLAEVANIYAVVGDEIEGVEGATQSLVSTMAAFKDEMNGMSDSDFAMSIVDKMNEVSNNFAISSGGIGEALQRSASSMAAANNTIDETIAMITAANEVAQNPQKVGNAFKTMSMRIRGAKTELEEAGESTDGMAESTASLRQEMLALSGVDIMLDKNTFKSTYQIMDELSKKWKDLTDIQQATIIELVAGKHQGNIFSSLMANFDTAREALNTSLESSGSAMAEHAKWSESLEARLNKLKATWQSFAQSFMNSDILKGGIDALRIAVDLLDKLTQSLGTFGTIGLGVGIFKIFKHKSGFSFILKELSTFGSIAYDAWKSGGRLSTRFKDIGRAAGSAAGNIGGKLTGSLSGMVGAIGLAVAAIGLIYNQYKKAKEAAAEARQETISASDDFLNAASSFEQAYIKYSGKTDLTAEEESELTSAISGTVDALGDKSSALQSAVNSSNDYLASLEAIKNAELEAAKSAAEEKRKNAADTLKEAAIGWESFDGSEVNISFGTTKLANGTLTEYGNAAEVAKKMLSDYYSETTAGKDGHYNAEITLSSDADTSEIVKYYNFLLDYKKELENAGLTESQTDSYTVYEQVNSAIEKMSESIGVYVDGTYDAVKANYQLSNGIPKTTEAYIAMREAILSDNELSGFSLNQKMSVLNSLDSEYGQLFDLSSVDAQARKFVGIIKGYGDGTKDGTDEIGTVETFLNMRTAVNNNECTVGQYLSELDNVTTMSNKFSDEEKKEFNLAFGLDTDSTKKQYEDVYNYISRNYLSKIDTAGMHGFDAQEFRTVEINKIKDLLKNLSATELRAVANIKGEINWETANIDEISAQIKEEAKFIEAMNYTIAIDVETESIEALNTAMAESVSGAGLSSESITALKGRYAELESEGYNLSAMFEETANGIHLNRKAVGEFEQKLASDKLNETDKQLGVLKDRYDELTKQINDCTDAGDRAALYTEQRSIVEKINDLATLAAQYEGLTSAYNSWQSAESAGSERDMYESVIEGFENIGDEISRGWLDDGTIKFLELMTGQTDLASKSASQLKQVWKDLDNTIEHTTYSVKDFFTVDEDGNATSKGVYNFLDAIGQMEEEKFGGKDVVKRDDNGKIIGFDFELVAKKDKDGNVIKNGDQVIAEALGISEELVQIMVRASDDAGFVVNLEGAYTQLADLKTEAEAARDSLISLKKQGNLKDVIGRTIDSDVNFDFDAEGNDLVTEQAKAVELLNKFKKDGEIDLSIKGAQDALDIAEYLTIKLDDLTEPKFMQIDTSEVEEDLRDPIEKIQEIGKLCKEKHLVTLTGDTKELKEVQGEIDKVAKEIEELKPEVKAQIGIDDSWDAKTIADKIEKGEIEIPAELELDVQMSDDLKDMRLMMMNQLGLVGDNEVKLKIGYDIDDSVIDSLTDEEKEVVVKYFAEHDEVDEYTPEQKEALVKYIADGGNLDDYTPEEKQAIVQYFADGGNVEEYTPEEKQAIVEYLTDSGDPDSWTPEQKEAVAKFKKDSAEVDNYSPEDKQAIAKFIKNSIEPDNYQTEDKTFVSKANLDSSEPDNYQPKDKKFTVKAILQKVGDWANNLLSGGSKRKIVNGTANADGTAYVNGTSGRAFKHGDWSTKDSGTALVGELGAETLVRNGRYYTIGDTGAEFIHYEKGDIIFNHKQTEELFRYGKVTSGGGRGKALVNGTAFEGGSSGTGGGIEPEVKSTTVGSKKKSSSKTSSSSTKDDFKETVDWIEIAIDRVERAIDKFDQKANNVYKSWSERNENLVNEISKVEEEIVLQQRAYDRYMQEANSVGLSASYAEKVRNGTIDIQTIKNESLKEKIDEYQKWYEKALDCEKAVEELKETESELYAQRFENIQKQYDGILQGYEHTESMLNEYIAQAEEKGYIVSKKYYDALINNEKSNIATLKKEQEDLIKARDEAVNSGDITKGSEAWYDMCNEIDSVTQSIEEGSTALLEYARAMEEIDWEIFDIIQERISNVSDEADFLIELMSNKKLFDDDGKLTSQGLATMALHGQNYNTHMYAADEYGAEIARLNKQISKDPYDQELINRRNELIELQRESILAAEDEKNAIRDMVEDGINFELDALQERIDKYNESIDAAKDLYDYQKDVQKQSEEIASLEKQRAAYLGNDSEEGKAKLQEIEVSLKEAKEDLKETEYERYISDQQALLDTLYNEYELILNQRIDNVDALLESVIASIDAVAGVDGVITSALGSDGAISVAIGNNAVSIKDTLKSEANKVGTTLSSAMNNIWSVGEGNAKSVLTMYGEDFKTKSTTIIATLNSIKSDIAAMVDDVDKDAKKKAAATKTTTSGKKEPVKTNTNTTNNSPTITPTIKPTTSSGDGKPKIGDKVKFVSGQYYYDSQGKKPLGYHNRGKEVYITSINKKSWATHPYHISTGSKLGKGDLGWLKLNQLSGYASGKNNFSTDENAWTQEGWKQEYIVRPSDGAILTPIAKGDSVLSATASNNIWDMANSPAEFIKENLNLGAAAVPNNSTVHSNYTQHLDKVVFNLPNVKNYDELLSAMQKDKNFERLILSMSIDRIAGKSSLGKGKSIR